jgi:hypothetical protein
MENKPSIEESFHINKLLDYLPIIIIAVIFFVGFFTWDIVRKELASFMMLILVFIYALWVRAGDTKSYKSWLTNPAENIIFPPIGTNPLVGDTPLGLSKLGIFSWVVMLVGIILGLGLGFGSIGINNKPSIPTNHTVNTLNVFGGFFSIGGIILVIYSLWKIFREDQPQSDDDKAKVKKAGLGGFIGSVLGFYMVARAKITDNEIKEIGSDETKTKEYNANPANNGATTALVIGLILQVVGICMVLFFLYAYNLFDLTNIGQAPRKSIGIVLFVALFLCGILWIGTSQRWPGLTFGNNTREPGDFNSNVFAAHGGIYMIFAAVFLVLLIGKLEKSTTYYMGGWVLAVLFLGCYIWNMVDMIRQGVIRNTDQEKIDTDEKVSILREEVAKQLKKDEPSKTYTDAEITTNVEDRIKAQQKPSEVVNGVFMTLSVVVILMISVFRASRLHLGICGKFPADDSFFTNIITAIKTSPNTANAVYCNDLVNGAGFAQKTQDTTAFKKIKDGEIDNITGTEWDALLNTYYDNLAVGGGDFSPTVVRAAKGAMWVPFLLVILIVMWIGIIFARVSTSVTGNAWIASNFTGDMFPRVKELLDSFFIVLIVGFLLCAILLLPMVKELNVGGLDTILRFAESIQVWQYNAAPGGNTFPYKSGMSMIAGIVFGIGLLLTWYWDYLRVNTENNKLSNKLLDYMPNGWVYAIAFVVLFTICSIPGWYFIASSHNPDPAFIKETVIVRWIRLIFTAIYLIPWLFITIFKLILFLPTLLFGNQTDKTKFNEELDKLAFWKWTSETDLRLFNNGAPIKAADVTSMAAAAVAAPAPAPGAAPPATSEPVGIDETKVSAIGKLIKVILLTISFVILILAVIYYVYKIDATNRAGGAEQDVASGGFVAQMNSPTAHTIYVIMAIVAIAGFVAYLRDKFKTANQKTPEDYLFNDFKPEDINSPMRQLTFGMTHIIYVVLMIIVWVYDTEKDDKNRMSVTGMTVLGLAILFFHYGLEFIDNKDSGTGTGTGTGTPPKMAPMTNLLTNIRFIMNTIFFIVLCALAYYKQHGVMVALIVFMFLFHLTKSIIGVKLLKLLWACIIYIPCLFLDFLQGSQNAVGDTTRPIWIIVAIELLLIAILYGGPYLLNYIGASASQIVAAPVSLKQLYDTNLTTQSPQIFIYHNTGVDRTPEDKAANCPAEEKKRYHYSISGWFFLNNNVTTKNSDLEIFNFGDVPRLTYNPSKNELKLYCHHLRPDSSITDEKSTTTEIYNSRTNYNAAVKDGSTSDTKRAKIRILTDNEELDTDIQLQRWNYFVVNYDGKTMDFFLNNKLIFKSDFIMPDIQLKPITVGSTSNNRGLNGSICNFAFHKYPLTKEQIRWTYNMLKTQNPPMIGMSTIQDEVKVAGSTTLYSR